ncbi:TetR/AcrR family transcriptional regulator [Paludibacterium paludis]|uniref:TetR family transcriptional regulator n=1 Tax=Paludibacterium paludis TaxID=1225769 RepID=A0A918P688_9NEIS|nr:TetR/AcrR family transcriptional regulator [Paludibacterium paludis]GGY26718.1 TetR family transcriptional regulator [Paludibacterium paludis]
MRVKSEARRENIARAAMEVFLENGFEAASMSDIARRAGGSKATLYSYFDSKQELFAEVMDTLCSGRFKAVYDHLEFDGDVARTLTRFGTALLLTLMEPDLMAIRRTVIAASKHDGVGRLFYERGPKLGWSRIQAFLEDQTARGTLACPDSWQATVHLLSLLEGDWGMRAMLGVIDKAEPADVERYVASAVGVFLRAYGTERSRVKK